MSIGTGVGSELPDPPAYGTIDIAGDHLPQRGSKYQMLGLTLASSLGTEVEEEVSTQRFCGDERLAAKQRFFPARTVTTDSIYSRICS